MATDPLDGYKPNADRFDSSDPTPTVPPPGWSEARLDDYRNELTGVGALRDKTLGGAAGLKFDVPLLSGQDCEDRWRGSDLGGRIVETIPSEMMREGFKIAIQPSEKDAPRADADMPFAPAPAKKPGALPELDDEGAAMAEQLMGRLEELGASAVIQEALEYERAYGGGAVLIGADDGQDLMQPLNLDAIREVRHLTAFRGGWDGEVIGWSFYGDVRGARFGEPEVYQLRNLGVPFTPGAKSPTQVSTLAYVHESRFLIFPGKAASRRVRNLNRGWGDSVFIRIERVLSQFGLTWGAVAILMQELSQGVLKIKGLAERLARMAGSPTAANQGGSNSIVARALAMEMSMSIARTRILDADEDFQRVGVPLTGVPEILQQFALRLAAACDMPVTLLMGQAPAGLNATGDSDVRSFYDRVKGWQRRRLLPQLQRLVRVVMEADAGEADAGEPEKWAITFNPLWQPTSAEVATTRKTIADADVAYIREGVVTPEEVAATRFGGSEYNDGPIVLDIDGRQAMAAQDEKDAEERARAAAEAIKNPQPVPGATVPAEKAPEKPVAEEKP